MSDSKPTPNPPQKSYVWRSTEASRAAGQVSILAVVETVLSVAACWGLAQWFDMTWILFTSVALAFFVLLRSDESIAQGRDRFIAYTNDEAPLTKTAWTLIFFIAVICAGATAWWLSIHWLNDFSGWALILRSAIVSFIVSAVGIAAAIAAAGTVAVAAVVAEAVAEADAAMATGAGVPAGMKVLITFFPALLLGTACRAVAVRFWATLCHVHKGVPRFAKNWATLSLHTDLFTPPELIPDLPVEHRFHFNNFCNEALSAKHLFQTTFMYITFFLFYLPSIFYRYYLKSTAWLYFPLIWIARVPGRVRGEDGKLIWDRAQRRSLMDKIGFGLASLTVGFFLWRIFDPLAVVQAIETLSSHSGLPTHPLLMFAGFEFSKIEGLHWLPPAAAACAVIAFLWTDRVHSRVDIYPDQQPGQVKIRTLLWLGNLAAGLAYAWIAIGVVELAWVTYDACQLPHYVQAGANALFGPPACALGPQP